jgi:hypothetical protein
MSTPAIDFVAVCGNANLPLNGTKATYLKAFKESGAAIGPSLTPADLKERFGALTWVRHAVANAIDPVTWPAMLSTPLLDVLRSLYPIPPQRPDAPAGETDLHRLAHMVSLFLPVGLSAASANATPALPTTPGGGINTSRPAVPLLAPATAPTAAPAPPPPPPSTSAPTGKKRWLMHDDLHVLLPEAVYTALDSNAHLPADKRFKMQEACKKSNTSALFDPATGAPFGHQLQLSLADGAHFDPPKRGLALAIAGRSAGLEFSGGGSLVDATGRRAVLLEFRSHWTQIEADFGGTHELSGTNVNRLWEGVSFVMHARAARATTWGCPEVELACREQYEALPAYRAAVATSVSRAASALPACDAARSVNAAYLSFFLPFWWEHVLLRSRLDKADVAKVSKEILSRAPPPPYAPEAWAEAEDAFESEARAEAEDAFESP